MVQDFVHEDICPNPPAHRAKCLGRGAVKVASRFHSCKPLPLPQWAVGLQVLGCWSFVPPAMVTEKGGPAPVWSSAPVGGGERLVLDKASPDQELEEAETDERISSADISGLDSGSFAS